MKDESKSEKDYPVSASKLSKTPSWIMLGFLLGAIFVAALPPLRRKPPPETSTLRSVEPPPPAAPREAPQLTTIEAVFAEWGQHAVWSDDITEVALWNVSEKAYSDFYEVRRIGDTHYFRSIPRLTRRIISRGKPLPNSPLQFTETEEQYREWQKYGRSERPVERAPQIRPRFAPPPEPSRAVPSVEVSHPALPTPKLAPPVSPPDGADPKNPSGR